MAPLALALALLVLLAVPAAHAEPWRRPVDGRVLRAFSVGEDPYARGQHRGVDLASAAGSRVRSACPGRVSFAGSVPGGERTVSVRCGVYVATYQQLGTIIVRRGQGVLSGTTLATVGPSADPYDRRPHLHLGAREVRTGRYVDPLTLVRGVWPGVPLLPSARDRPRAIPRGRVPFSVSPRAAAPDRVPVAGQPRVAAPDRVPVAAQPRVAALDRVPVTASPVPAPPPPAPPPGVPWTVWVGLAGVATALPLRGFARLRRRRRTATAFPRTA